MATQILIVEDESIVALDIRSSLTKLGYSVCGICSRGDEAVKKVHEFSPSLVLMDIRLAGEVDGITAAAEIRRTTKIPVVYLTAHADETTLARAKVTEPFGYVLKPFQPIELRVAIELALFKASQPPQPAESPAEPPLRAKPINVHPEVFHYLRSIPAFSAIPVDQLQTFTAACSLQEYKAGQTFAFEGDADRAVGFLVLRGRVSLFKTSVSGREIIVELLSPNDVFGIALALEQQPFDCSARAQVDSFVIHVPRRAIVGLLEKNVQLYRFLLDVIAGRLSSSHTRSRSLAHDKVEVRIASGLLSLIPVDADEHDSAVPILHVTRKELAELCGTTVETSIRVTKSMESTGILEFPENGFVRILDQEALKDIVSGAAA